MCKTYLSLACLVPDYSDAGRQNRARPVRIAVPLRASANKSLNREPWFETVRILVISTLGVNPDLPFAIDSLDSLVLASESEGLYTSGLPASLAEAAGRDKLY